MQALLGFTSEARWLRYAGRHLRHPFPYLPGQSGYNKRLRRTGELERKVDELVREGKISAAAAGEVRQAVAQLGNAVERSG